MSLKFETIHNIIKYHKNIIFLFSLISNQAVKLFKKHEFMNLLSIVLCVFKYSNQTLHEMLEMKFTFAWQNGFYIKMLLSTAHYLKCVRKFIGEFPYLQ